MTFLICFQVNAQDLLQSSDLSSIKVDALSESDIVKIKNQLQTNGTSIEQMESVALSRGMSKVEYDKLKVRVNGISGNSSLIQTQASIEESVKSQEPINSNKLKDIENELIFGSELFDNPTLDFSPDLKLATPVNYILGPGDELQISIYGVQEFNTTALVSSEGKISIQFVGQISVSGMTIEAATQKVKSSIAKIYSTVSSGQSQVSITLSKIRTIRVTIVGGKQPGNYAVSSLATVYNALHLAGGPGKNGSYRNIELIRNNKVYKNIDIYRFLVKGDQSDNLGLKENDVIRIPSYTHRVTLNGEVKRPGIFEMKKGESFLDLLNFASGFNDFAYTASVSIQQKTAKELKVSDINESDFGNYLPQAGDVFRVSRILDRFENRIKIDGAVFRPDTYSYSEGMRVSDLVARAEGLKEDAYTKRARIIRLKPDLTSEIINVDLAAVLSGDLNADIELKREDVVTVYSVLDFQEEYKVTIDGEVKNPGVYKFYDNLTLNDLVVQVGGLTGSAAKRVEIARMIKSDEINNNDPRRVEVINLELTPENNEQVRNYILMPFDVINVRRVAVYEKPQVVEISGAVNYPGKYVLANKKETVYSIVTRAGGLTSIANIEGMKIKRPINKDQLMEISNTSADSLKDDLINKLKNDVKYATIPVNWGEILKNNNHYSNVTLFPGDKIEVSDFNEGVKVVGNVLLNSEIPYRKGKSFNYYLSAVGGVNSKGWKRKAYIIYPNGKAATTESFLFFRSYPKVLPDSQIVVPEKPETTKLSTGELISIASVITSLALLIVTAFK